jgi:hypothetical protein
MSPQGSNSIRHSFRGDCNGLLFMAVLVPLYQSIIVRWLMCY